MHTYKSHKTHPICAVHGAQGQFTVYLAQVIHRHRCQWAASECRATPYVLLYLWDRDALGGLHADHLYVYMYICMYMYVYIYILGMRCERMLSDVIYALSVSLG